MEGALRLCALCESAQALGLSPGLGLAEARARFPGLDARPADEGALARLLDDLACWCERWTPLVAFDGPDGLILDISGCAHLFGGEAAMLTDIVRRLRAQGIAGQAAVAAHAATARALARHAPGTVLAAGAAVDALSPLPAAALGPEPRTAALLSRLGLKRVGDVLALPRAGAARRFGPDFMRRLDEATGRARSPIGPRRPVPLILHEQRLFEPVSRQEDILRIAEVLAARVAGDLERRGEGARRLELALFRVDGAVERIDVALSRPARNPARLSRLFKERLTAGGEERDAGFGYDLVRLCVLVADPLDETQATFAEASGERREPVEALIDRLSARLGEVAVHGLDAVESHRPERAQIRRPGMGGECAARALLPEAQIAPRPLRLLAPPEPVETTAEVPEGAPALFRWRRALHRVCRVEGPERIAPEWWRTDAGETRDYWRVEDEAGRRFWLYREGRYGEARRPAWYLHGLFA
ncbi:Y-family DNA polymerase [Aureimonas mangrovi]|uniref:Y-family DNA polymerase n=1 Tax=Aureimonas mangrovi TaxID=2758041 RepID=UPI001FE3D3DA|nr:DNA polymerase Y family protein [Aureimonas mangrovi]